MKKRILIIDDKEWSVDRLIEKFHAFDSEIVICGPAKTCAEARTALQAHDDYNLIFTCSSLPDGDLIEVFRETKPRCFVIFTTLPDEATRQLVKKLRYGNLLGIRNEFPAFDLLDWLWQASLRLLGICGAEDKTLEKRSRCLCVTSGNT